MPRLSTPAGNPAADDRQILPPAPADQAASITIPRGPNIQSPTPQQPLPPSLVGRVLIVAGDDISTGDLSPDGAEIMAYRSNIKAMASYVFRRIDPDFAERSRDWGGGFIVAGQNYGQGSSREQAAMAPKELGVTAVIAKSYARIHRRNLVAQGIVPLTFLDEDDYFKAREGNTWELPTIRESLERADAEIPVLVRETGATIRVCCDVSAREREVLVNGGLRAHLRHGGGPMSTSLGHSDQVDQGSPWTAPVPDEIVK
jgi:aconitate hydratase